MNQQAPMGASGSNETVSATQSAAMATQVAVISTGIGIVSLVLFVLVGSGTLGAVAGLLTFVLVFSGVFSLSVILVAPVAMIKAVYVKLRGMSLELVRDQMKWRIGGKWRTVSLQSCHWTYCPFASLGLSIPQQAFEALFPKSGIFVTCTDGARVRVAPDVFPKEQEREVVAHLQHHLGPLPQFVLIWNRDGETHNVGIAVGSPPASVGRDPSCTVQIQACAAHECEVRLDDERLVIHNKGDDKSVLASGQINPKPFPQGGYYFLTSGSCRVQLSDRELFSAYKRVDEG